MTDLTELEEQQMIEKARAGDPEANYKMSFWALEQAAAEPDEDRWNRLAAKCLVRAAEAGYAPARERMAKLLRELDEREQAEAKPAVEEIELEIETKPAPRRSVAEQEYEAATAPAAGKLSDLGKTAAEKGKTLAGRAAGLVSGLFSGSGGHGASGWSENKWKRMQLMCIIACIVLAFLIALMIFTGKSDRREDEEVQMPVAATAEPVSVTPSPSPVPYPDEETRTAIHDAELSIYPESGDYVSQAMTATVDVSAGLKLRTGPATSYDQIVLMEVGSEVPVYAMKNGWALVLYEGETYGWCSDDYLDMD